MSSYLEHVNITTSNCDLMVEFLGTAIPEWKVRNGATSENCKWLHFGSERFYIAIEEREGPNRSPQKTYFHPGLNHYGIVVDEVDSLMKRMISAGYREGNHVLDHPHRKRCYFFDHDDGEWEFVEYLSGEVSERNDYSNIS